MIQPTNNISFGKLIIGNTQADKHELTNAICSLTNGDKELFDEFKKQCSEIDQKSENLNTDIVLFGGFQEDKNQNYLNIFSKENNKKSPMFSFSFDEKISTSKEEKLSQINKFFEGVNESLGKIKEKINVKSEISEFIDKFPQENENSL